jgi:signal transduction histidine kinase
VDGLIVAVVAAAQIAGTYAASRHQTDRRSFDALAWLLLLAGPLALLARRKFPATVLTVVYLVTLAYAVRGYAHGPIFLALIVAFFTAVLAGRRAFAIAILAIGYVSFLWMPYWFGRDTAPSWAGIAGLAAWLLVLLAAAEGMRTQRDRAAAAARMRAEEERRRISDERLRIAREVHDVVAHNISMINVQAGVALHLLEERPEQARIALAAIKDASKETLRELRAVLGVLRRVDEEDAPRGPTAGLERLPELLDRTRATGLAVDVEVDGTPRPLPTEVDLAAFRILQEALTNVSRHAGPATAHVRIAFDPHAVVLQVDDTGRGLTQERDGTSGSGITGMRERASALGGDLRVESRPHGGVRVLATLPSEPTTS